MSLSGSIDPSLVDKVTRFDVMRAAVLICARVTLCDMWKTWVLRQAERILTQVNKRYVHERGRVQ